MLDMVYNMGIYSYYIIIRVIRKEYINIHEDLASIEDININFYNLLYLLSITIVVALGVYLVGGLITVALMAIPAVSAKNVVLFLMSIIFRKKLF